MPTLNCQHGKWIRTSGFLCVMPGQASCTRLPQVNLVHAATRQKPIYLSARHFKCWIQSMQLFLHSKMCNLVPAADGSINVSFQVFFLLWSNGVQLHLGLFVLSFVEPTISSLQQMSCIHTVHSGNNEWTYSFVCYIKKCIVILVWTILQLFGMFSSVPVQVCFKRFVLVHFLKKHDVLFWVTINGVNIQCCRNEKHQQGN